MAKHFNTTGPIIPEKHYHLPPLERVDLKGILKLLDDWKYFVLHAPRQTGKTTVLGALETLLNDTGRYRCVYVNVEPGQTARSDVRAGIWTVLGCLEGEANRALGDTKLEKLVDRAMARLSPHLMFASVLAGWAALDPSRPLVLLIDEIDSLVGDTLISVLRQLRRGYRDRPARFPQSVVLCGVRDVRDYRIRTSDDELVLGGSAFNIKAKAWRLGDFSESETRSLLTQHTDETGQRFTEEALAEVWRATCGQPWLANALARDACFDEEGVLDRSVPITVGDIVDARERLILRRETHLDQLADKLHEPRVKRVVEPIVTSGSRGKYVHPDDVDYARDLGLISPDGLTLANPIYREVIPRELTFLVEPEIQQRQAWYVAPDGHLITTRLMAGFQSFFRENSESWVERFQYKEAGPQLLLQAFLQRVVNAGGRIEREYGVGRRRMDLAVIWRLPGAAAREQRVVIECKILHAGVNATINEGLPQTVAYMDTWAAEEGHLVLFDRSPDRTWDEKIFRRKEKHDGREITVWGM